MANLRKWFPFKREGHGHGMRMHAGGGHPVAQMQREMNRVFDQLLSGGPGDWNGDTWYGDFSAGRFLPNVDISDEGKALQVTVELPGMTSKDVEVTLLETAVRIRGEKKVEKASKGEEGYYRTECSYGAFERTIPLPVEVDHDHAEAKFDHGVLAIRLPKRDQEREKGRRLEITG